MEYRNLPVQSSTIRPLFGPEDIHQVNETRCSLPQKESHSHDNILGRYPDPGSVNKGVLREHSDSSRPPSVPGFHNQLREIYSQPLTGNYIPGVRRQLRENVTFSPSRESSEDHRVLSPPKAKKSTNFSLRHTILSSSTAKSG